jgi:hypothetical protein
MRLFSTYIFHFISICKDLRDNVTMARYTTDVCAKSCVKRNYEVVFCFQFDGKEF